MTKLASTSGVSSSTSAAAKVLLAIAASTCVCCTLPLASAFVHVAPSPVHFSPSLSTLRIGRHTHDGRSSPSTSSANSVRLQARRRRRRYDDDDDEEDGYDDEDLYYDDGGYAYDDEDDYYDEEPRRRRGRRRPISSDDLGTAGDGSQMQVPSPFGLRSGLRLPDSVSKAVLAGIFVLGIGTGVTIDSQINTNPKDLASRDAIDQNAPNPVVCARYGASAMAFDQRVFVSFNPFNVYVAQADVKPACVLRQSNVVQVLQQSGLINDNEVRACKRNMVSIFYFSLFVLVLFILLSHAIVLIDWFDSLIGLLCVKFASKINYAVCIEFLNCDRTLGPLLENWMISHSCRAFISLKMHKTNSCRIQSLASARTFTTTIGPERQSKRQQASL